MDEEEAEGYVVDIACLRKYPRSEWAERARRHSRSCALMGHCIESGYGLVSGDGIVFLLEPAATPQVIEAIQAAPVDAGIRLRVLRRPEGEAMVTSRVRAVNPASQQAG